MATAFIFPGQGAQQVGMGKDLYESFAAARTIFDLAEDVSGLPLKRLCFEGPEEELSRTDICQPAIFTVSAALLASLDSLLPPEKVESMRPAYMAGLSLGEYTALYAADCVDFQDALRLVTLRGAAMQKAATAVPSGMVAVMGLDEAKATELCAAAGGGEVLVPANLNAPGQVVLSGAAGACQRAIELAPRFGASGAVALKVAGAFHSPLMAPAAAELAKALDGVRFRAPRGRPRVAGETPATQLVSNVEAAPYGGMERAKDLLLAQLTSPVRWEQSVRYMIAAGVASFVEIGPGRVLAGLMRRIERKAEVKSLNTADALAKLGSQLA